MLGNELDDTLGLPPDIEIAFASERVAEEGEVARGLLVPTID